jgi:hypothetical protein
MYTPSTWEVKDVTGANVYTLNVHILREVRDVGGAHVYTLNLGSEGFEGARP